jgi:hypothetical protein
MKMAMKLTNVNPDCQTNWRIKMALQKKTTVAATETNAAPAAAFEGMEDSGTTLALVTDVKPEAAVSEASLADTKPAAAEAAPVTETVIDTVAASKSAEAQAAAEVAAATATPAVVLAEPTKGVQTTEGVQSTETAVAVKAEGALVVAKSKKFVGALSEKENNFDPTALDFNTFPRVTVGLDGFSNDDGTDLGKTIQLEVLSYNTRWVASPGTDDDEAKKLVRYSLDGKTIDSTGDDNGQDIFAYIEEMKKVHGYEDAGLKKYLAIYGFMVASNDEIIAEEDREIVALQVPPQSRALFDRYQITRGVQLSRGVVKASDIVVCRQEKKTGGSKKYALIHFAAK